MGAEQFETRAWGHTAKEAFSIAVEQARYDHGHSGYSGTIAEKNGFKLFEPLDEIDIDEQIEWALDGEGEPPEHADLFKKISDVVDDKWGPAACFPTGREKGGMKEFVFFGWASH